MDDFGGLLQEGFIYFKSYGKIKLLEIPRFGSVTLKTQNGEIVSSVESKTTIFNKNTDWKNQRYSVR